MSEWNYDISAAPRGQLEVTELPGRNGSVRRSEKYVAPRVILALECGMVLTSRWIPPDTVRKTAGRWEFIGRTEQPIAWQPYPTHPRESDNAEA